MSDSSSGRVSAPSTGGESHGPSSHASPSAQSVQPLGAFTSPKEGGARAAHKSVDTNLPMFFSHAQPRHGADESLETISSRSTATDFADVANATFSSVESSVDNSFDESCSSIGGDPGHLRAAGLPRAPSSASKGYEANFRVLPEGDRAQAPGLPALHMTPRRPTQRSDLSDQQKTPSARILNSARAVSDGWIAPHAARSETPTQPEQASASGDKGALGRLDEGGPIPFQPSYQRSARSQTAPGVATTDFGTNLGVPAEAGTPASGPPSQEPEVQILRRKLAQSEAENSLLSKRLSTVEEHLSTLKDAVQNYFESPASQESAGPPTQDVRRQQQPPLPEATAAPAVQPNVPPMQPQPEAGSGPLFTNSQGPSVAESAAASLSSVQAALAETEARLRMMQQAQQTMFQQSSPYQVIPGFGSLGGMDPNFAAAAAAMAGLPMPLAAAPSLYSPTGAMLGSPETAYAPFGHGASPRDLPSFAMGQTPMQTPMPGVAASMGATNGEPHRALSGISGGMGEQQQVQQPQPQQPELRNVQQRPPQRQPSAQPSEQRDTGISQLQGNQARGSAIGTLPRSPSTLPGSAQFPQLAPSAIQPTTALSQSQIAQALNALSLGQPLPYQLPTSVPAQRPAATPPSGGNTALPVASGDTFHSSDALGVNVGGPQPPGGSPAPFPTSTPMHLGTAPTARPAEERRDDRTTQDASRISPDILVARALSGRGQEVSIALQQQLKTGSEDRKMAILRAMRPHLARLAEDKHCNFLVQRAFGLDPKIAFQLRGHFVDLSLSQFGCHVVQRVLDEDEDLKIAVVDELLARRVRETLTSRNSIHVWQKVLELHFEKPGYRAKLFDTINKTMKGHWAATAMLETGSIICQNIFESGDADEKRDCIDEILERLCDCAANQWGVWVVQHIVEHGEPHHRDRAFDKLVSQAVPLTLSQFGQKAIMSALKSKDPGFLAKFLDAICDPDQPSSPRERGNGVVGTGTTSTETHTADSSRHQPPAPTRRSPLVDIASTPQGLQIVAQLLTSVTPQQRDRVIKTVRRNSVSLKGSKSGLRVHQLCERARAYSGY